MKANIPYQMTVNQRKAMNAEINRQIAENDAKYAADIDAMVLYVLMEQYGWRKKRLRKFWDAFNKAHKELRDFYQMDNPGDNEWLAHRMLNNIGVDIHQWYKEDNQNENQN